MISRKYSILSAVMAAGMLASAANAAIIVTTTRVPNVEGPGATYDDVYLSVYNTGGTTGAVGGTLASANVTIAASTLRLGGTANHGNTTGDPSGANGAVSTGTYVDAYSWIGNGGLVGTFSAASTTPNPAATANASSSYGNVSLGVNSVANSTNYVYGTTTSFNSQGGWTSQPTTSGANVNGGFTPPDVSASLGAIIALAVVPHGTAVTFSGSIGGSVGSAQAFTTTDGVTAVNEFVTNSTGNNGESVTTTVNMTANGNHINPNYTPEITVGNAKGLITINSLATTGVNELLVFTTLTLAQLQAINGNFQAVGAQWSSTYPTATAEIALPVGAQTYTTAYDFSNASPGVSGTLNGIAVVPEPASLGLLALGALGLLGKRRSK